jgi:hypothetical protein
VSGFVCKLIGYPGVVVGATTIGYCFLDSLYPDNIHGPLWLITFLTIRSGGDSSFIEFVETNNTFVNVIHDPRFLTPWLNLQEHQFKRNRLCSETHLGYDMCKLARSRPKTHASSIGHCQKTLLTRPLLGVYRTGDQGMGTRILDFMLWIRGTVLWTVSLHPSTCQLCSRHKRRSSRLANCHKWWTVLRSPI